MAIRILPRSGLLGKARPWRFSLLLLWLIVGALPPIWGAKPDGGPEKNARRVITGSQVCLRVQPSPSAREVGRLELGTIVAELQRTPKPATIGRLEDFWYEVKTATGGKGWVFGAFTRPIPEPEEAERLAELIDERLQRDLGPLVEEEELLKLAGRFAETQLAKPGGTAAQLGRYLALQRFLTAWPAQKSQEVSHHPLVHPFANQLIFNEPAGSWVIDCDVLWRLEEGTRGSPLGEKIAWAAAHHPLPGETEGYVPAVLGKLKLTTLRYLDRYPQGSHAGAAIAELISHLGDYFPPGQELSAFQMPREDLPLVLKDLQSMRETIGHATAEGKKTLVAKLATCEQLFRQAAGAASKQSGTKPRTP